MLHTIKVGHGATKGTSGLASVAMRLCLADFGAFRLLSEVQGLISTVPMFLDRLSWCTGHGKTRMQPRG